MNMMCVLLVEGFPHHGGSNDRGSQEKVSMCTWLVDFQWLFWEFLLELWFKGFFLSRALRLVT